MKKSPTPLQLLNELEFAAKCKKWPNVDPLHIPQSKHTDKKANRLTDAIKTWINLSGGQAERISTTGRPLDRRTTYEDVLGHKRQIGSLTWIPGTSTPGSADISATIKLKSNPTVGISVKIEIKVGRDIQSDRQKKYQQQVEQAGGIYLLIHSFSEFYSWWVENVV